MWLLDELNAQLVDLAVGKQGLKGECWEYVPLRKDKKASQPLHRMRAQRGKGIPWHERPSLKKRAVDLPVAGDCYLVPEVHISGITDEELFFLESGHNSTVIHLAARLWASDAAVQLLNLLPEGILEIPDSYGDLPMMSCIRTFPYDETPALLIESTPSYAFTDLSRLWTYFDVECTCLVRLSILKRVPDGYLAEIPASYWQGRSNPFHSFLRRIHCEQLENGCEACTEGLKICLDTLPVSWLSLKSPSGCTPLHEALLQEKHAALELLCERAPEEAFGVEGPLQESSLSPTAGSLLEAAVRARADEALFVLITQSPLEVRRRPTSDGRSLLELYDSMHYASGVSAVRDALQPVVKGAQC